MKKRILALTILLIVFKILSDLIVGKIDYYPNGEGYYYSNLSIKNGINISRWYAELRGFDSSLGRILFNKATVPVLIIMKNLTLMFQHIIEFLF